ncbi:hypothetical protein HWV62_24852 [Athelia sp. TMB]|nr:hypothetical protein HWV62_24852 [Athelia sp. TMB]
MVPPGLTATLRFSAGQLDMPRFNGDRRRHALLISERLEGIAAARRKLVLQLEELDEQAKIMQHEFNVLHNLDALTSNLPDEALAMIFEAGALPGSTHWPHFGVVVSHVSSRWRRVALSTARLWTEIVWRASDSLVWRSKQTEQSLKARAIAFLERSRFAPLDITILQYRLEGFSPDFLQLLNDHIGRYRNLCIKDVQQSGLVKVVESLSNTASLLSSIDLSSENMEFDIDIQLPLLFPSGAPCLKTVQLHNIDSDFIQLSLPAFGSVASLRLTGLAVEDTLEGYEAFRNALMALQSLHHLELQLEYYLDDDISDLPVVLPTVQFMRLQAPPGHLDTVIRSFKAANLLALSLEGWNGLEYEIGMEDLSTLRFPSLEHLILTGISVNKPFLDAYAQRFPDITRLTCQVYPNAPGCDIDYVLTPICHGTQKYEYPDFIGPPEIDVEWDRWPKLEVIAVSATDTPLDPLLYTTVSIATFVTSLRKLMLPHALCAQVGADVMAKLREEVQVEDYILDWPTPFPKYTRGTLR